MLPVLGGRGCRTRWPTLEVTFAAKSCTPVAPVAPAVTQATCTAGAVVPPSVALPPTTGIVYVVAPASLGNGTSPSRGDGDGDGDGRVRVGDDQPRRGSGSMRRRRRGRRRWRRRRVREVTPVAPTVIQAVCVAGVVTPPTLTSPSTTGITYTVAPAGPYVQGQSVTVTATLAPAGVGWPANLPVRWTAGVGHGGDARGDVRGEVVYAGDAGGAGGDAGDVHGRCGGACRGGCWADDGDRLCRHSGEFG